MTRTEIYAVLICLTLGGCEKPCKEGFQRYGAECVRSPEKDASVDAIDGRPDADASGSTNTRDGEVTTDAGPLCYLDQDGDGIGAGQGLPCDNRSPDAEGSVLVEATGDCDDEDDRRSPSLSDTCGDSIDNDCDGKIDPDVANACGGPCTAQLGHQPGELCSSGLGACQQAGAYRCTGPDAVACDAVAGMSSAEVCDGVDNNCDGKVDEGMTNACGGSCLVGLAHQPSDLCSNGQLGECLRQGKYVCKGSVETVCDAPVVVAGKEVCSDELDNDCDGKTNESDAIDIKTWYRDCDVDGFATDINPSIACAEPVATTSCKAWRSAKPGAGTSLDCDDSNDQYRPDQTTPGFTAPGKSADRNCDGVVTRNRGMFPHAPGATTGPWGDNILPCPQAELDRLNSNVCPTFNCFAFGASSPFSGEPPELCVDDFPSIISGPPAPGQTQCNGPTSLRGGVKCL